MTGAGKVVKNASISVYRAGADGYGSAATLLGSAMSDANGHWSVAFTKPTDGSLIYVLADGGDAGAGVNDALALMAGVGPTDSVPANIVVNEVTTVAAVYALTQFLDVPGRNVGAPAANMTGLANAFGTILNLIDADGHAVATADPFTPVLVPRTGASVAPPGRTINTLANAIAACIDSNGHASTPCAALFAAVVIAGRPAPSDTRQALLGIAAHPAEFIQPLVALAHSASAPNQPDFGSELPNDWTLGISYVGGALSNTTPTSVAIDSSGSVWVAAKECDPAVTNRIGCVMKLQPSGARAGLFPTSPQSGALDLSAQGGRALAIATDPATGRQTVFIASDRGSYVVGLDAQTVTQVPASPIDAAGHIAHPQAIVADAAGTLWVVNASGAPQADGSSLLGITQLLPGSQHDFSVNVNFDVNVPASPGGFSSIEITDIALESSADGPAGLWLADAVNSRMVRLDMSTPGQFGGARQFGSPAISGPLAVDGSGNVWVPNEALGGVIEFVKGMDFAVRSFTTNAVCRPGDIAVDGAGRLWISNVDCSGVKGVLEVDQDGSAIPYLTDAGAFLGGYPRSAGGPLGPQNIGVFPGGTAVDPSGNVWVAGGDAGTLMEIVGAATPVR